MSNEANSTDEGWQWYGLGLWVVSFWEIYELVHGLPSISESSCATGGHALLRRLRYVWKSRTCDHTDIIQVL